MRGEACHFGHEEPAAIGGEKSEGPKQRDCIKMQTFGLGPDGMFGQEQQDPDSPAAGLNKGERFSPCGQFIINANGEWKPNPAKPPSRQGARDPSDPMISTRPAVKFGRRATPKGTNKPQTLASDKKYEQVL